MKDTVEEIKKRVDIVDFISQYVPLKKRGSNYFGLCPFHAEKTPSFSVNPKGNFFHCFGCGASGDVITFLMKIENMEFKDAVKELANRYNIPITFKEKNELNPLIEIHKIAEEYFHIKLQKNPHALDYLYKRNLDKGAIDRFSLGYAPQSSELEKHLVSKGFTISDLIKSGIFIDTAKGLFNRFSGRIIFPIKNESGQTIAFGGRIINHDKTKAKYLNSPETAVFSKQKVLYGIDSAKEMARKTKKIILTEGYMDCIRLKLNGYENTVATLGTALSKFHISLIKRYADEIYLNYDSDEAGFKAMIRSAPTILSSNLKPYVIILEKGEDPDSFLTKNPKEKYTEKITQAKEYFSYIVEFLKNKYNLENPHEKIKAIDELKPIVNSIFDPIVKAAYLTKASKIFNVSENVFLVRHSTFDFLSSITKEDALLSIVLKDIELMSWIEDLNEFGNNFPEKHREIYFKLVNIYLSGEELNIEEFTQDLNDEQKSFVYKLLSLPQTDVKERHERRKILLYIIAQFKIEQLKKRLSEIREQLKTQKNQGLIVEYNNTFKQLKSVINDWSNS